MPRLYLRPLFISFALFAFVKLATSKFAEPHLLLANQDETFPVSKTIQNAAVDVATIRHAVVAQITSAPDCRLSDIKMTPSRQQRNRSNSLYPLGQRIDELHGFVTERQSSYTVAVDSSVEVTYITSTLATGGTPTKLYSDATTMIAVTSWPKQTSTPLQNTGTVTRIGDNGNYSNSSDALARPGEQDSGTSGCTSLSIRSIVGIAVGSAGGIAIIIAVVLCNRRRRQQRNGFARFDDDSQPILSPKNALPIRPDSIVAAPILGRSSYKPQRLLRRLSMPLHAAISGITSSSPHRLRHHPDIPVPATAMVITSSSEPQRLRHHPDLPVASDFSSQATTKQPFSPPPQDYYGHHLHHLQASFTENSNPLTASEMEEYKYMEAGIDLEKMRTNYPQPPTYHCRFRPPSGAVEIGSEYMNGGVPTELYHTAYMHDITHALRP